ncbi:di-trans,poly-cis-decaprenylcistransferase [Candidatus Woesebacteria bacterium]|nr:di-trans,poly-cis-decaprenylcistransferase [Candidatus Woesebacteria bacterium]
MIRTKLSPLPKDTKVPNHVAIIPDGNRRWARSKNLHTLKGHKAGFERTVELGRAMRNFGIHTTTIWGFSTENWDRTEEEINYLMKLYHKLVDDYLTDAHKEKIRIFHLGRKDRLPKSLINKLTDAEKQTGHYTKFIVNIALDYGGHDDILRAVKKIVDKNIPSSEIDEELFTSYTDLHNQPYPYVDLMIRTSGEQRTSGFLLWQSHYTEYYWENSHFPDFTPEKLREAILDYSRRRRRFGGNDAEAHFKFKPEVIAKLELNWWRLESVPEGTRLRDYAVSHLVEQFGMSKTLAKKAAKYMVEGALEGKAKKWGKSLEAMKQFYQLVRDEIKLAFEPSLAASLQVKLWREIENKDDIEKAVEARHTARNLYAEVYRMSVYQAAKLAHLRVLANIEKNLAEAGMGDHHWKKAQDYLEKFYFALKERIA